MGTCSGKNKDKSTEKRETGKMETSNNKIDAPCSENIPKVLILKRLDFQEEKP